MTTIAERIRFLIGLLLSAVFCCFLIIVNTDVEASSVPEQIRTSKSAVVRTEGTTEPQKANIGEATKKAGETEKKKAVFSGPVQKPSALRPGAEPFEQPIPAAKPKAPKAEPKPEDLELIDIFTATAYCTTGTTATGTYTTAGRTLAVNPSMIAYGTHVWLFTMDGELVGDFYAEDTGSNMMEHPYVIDIYFGDEDTYDDCMQWGAQLVRVYTEPSE